ncbi:MULTISPECIES: FadR/GntR family transcriptional regulator [unclassified Brachybacterium]|uniref:FadR/GntR family transcriptional regulator n=1 Tax=unclassified Brachybacterium TaxID=2623841 RepID=UPI000C7F7A01|nr:MULTISPECIES: GntR family transcriptional regulator [unclassified Brachybacterium]PMC76988.1 GntR family transcriptional regulator [Brachybacterium sp. UMB0905]
MSRQRRPSASDTAAEMIRDLIVQRGLRPGDLLPTEVELVEELAVSRSSVREAIRKLDALDIVDVRHGHGTFVGAVSLRPLVDSVTFRSRIDARGALTTLEDIVEVRRALDVGYGRQVVEALAGTHHEDLHGLVAEMVEHAERGEPFPQQDRAFHAALMERATGNRLGEHLLSAFWDLHTDLVQLLQVPVPARIQRTAEAHGEMLRAAEAGDLPAYLAAVDEHYAPLIEVLETKSAQGLAPEPLAP